MDLNKIIARYTRLETSASQRDEWINRIARYAMPTLYNYKYDQSNTRANLPHDIFDSSMVQSAQIFSSGIYSYLTNPATHWLTLSLKQKELLNTDGVRDWLQHVENRVYSKLVESNFYPNMHMCYRSLIFGNCVLYREREGVTVRYRALPLAECYFERDYTGNIVSMWRNIKKTPLEIVSEFPTTVSEKVRKMAVEGSGETYINCIHVVRPRSHRDMKKFDSKNKAYESLVIDKDNKTLLKESGYDTFPFFIGSFIDDPSSAYGYGPGHMSLYDAKTLNQMMLTTIRAAQKQTDPPISLPHDGYIMPFLQDPGAVNFRLTSDPRDVAQPLSNAANFQVGLQMIADSRDRIRAAFFVDLFLSITNTTKRMTVPELQERIAERAPLLGPVIDNLTSGLLRNVITDLINIMADNEEIMPPPPSLEGSEYTIEWLSPLAKAQKISDLNAISAFGQLLAGAMQMNQDVVDNVDFDILVRQASDAIGLDQTIIREPGEVGKIREERYAAMAAMQQREETLRLAGAAEQATKADLNMAKARQ